MAVSGIVVTLVEDAAMAGAAVASLGMDARLTLGERFGRRVAAVAETGSPREDRRMWEELHAVPGVERVDVTFVALDEPGAGGESEMENHDGQP